MINASRCDNVGKAWRTTEWNGQNKDPYSNKEKKQPQEPDHHDISEILIDVFLGALVRPSSYVARMGFIRISTLSYS